MKNESIGKLARTPRWIGALLLAIAVAAGFALLSQWQLSRSVESAAPDTRTTETAVELSSVAEPQQPVESVALAQKVSVDGSFVAGDFTLVSGRTNGGAIGYWVVGHLLVESADDESDAAPSDAPSLAVALGWAPTEAEATTAIATIDGDGSSVESIGGALTGRYMPSEAPQESKFEEGERNTLALAALINEWHTAPDGVYGGYLVADAAPAGLDAIDSPRPSAEVALNWLNIFYAIEWVVFAGFAIFLWFRLVKDAWEREQEEAAEAAAAAGAGDDAQEASVN